MAFQWLFKKKEEHRGLLVGLDASGKTTLLYQLKLKEAVTTIPTIGFNVETIEHPKGSNFTLWDVGGCGQIQNLLYHYIQPGTFIVYLHDCSAEESWQQESVTFLREFIEMWVSNGCGHICVVMNKQDKLAPETRESVVREKSDLFEKVLRPYASSAECRVLQLPGLSAYTGERVYEILEEVHRMIAGKGKTVVAPPAQPVPAVAQEPTTEDLMQKITLANSKMGSADEFWQAFLRAEIESWDHHTHLRAGYAVLLEAFSRGDSLLRCAETFMDHLARLKSTNPDKFRNTAHKTMTAFWLFQLRLAALTYQADKGIEKAPSLVNFGAVLLHSPHLMNTGLWKKYYTKDLLFSPKARENWCFPDIQPLPTSIPKPKALLRQEQDQEKLESERLLRFAFIVVQKIMPTNRRRGEIIGYALEALKQHIIRERAKNPNVAPYSLTQAYFWIQIFHHARVSLEAAGEKSLPGLPRQISALSFEAFKALLNLKGDEWKLYYSPRVWNSIPARMEFQIPDLKPLPNALIVPPPSSIELARSKMLESIREGVSIRHEVPPDEDLAVMAAILIGEVGALEGGPNEIKTHGELLAHLYRRLVSDQGTSGDMGEEGRMGVSSRAVSVALELPCPYISGITGKMFWVQQVIAASAKAKAAGGQLSFAQFINGARHLAHEQLPLVYYSQELWESKEAADGFVPPDARPFPTLIIPTNE